jgi:hypothetical protein
MLRAFITLALLSVLTALGGCARKAAVEGTVSVTSTEPFQHLKGNTRHPPVPPQQ